MVVLIFACEIRIMTKCVTVLSVRLRDEAGQ
jgi:hypothetical protein